MKNRSMTYSFPFIKTEKSISSVRLFSARSRQRRIAFGSLPAFYRAPPQGLQAPIQRQGSRFFFLGKTIEPAGDFQRFGDRLGIVFAHQIVQKNILPAEVEVVSQARISSRPVTAAWCVCVGRRSAPIGQRTGPSILSISAAPTWAANWNGTRRKNAGTARATAPALTTRAI